MANLATRMAFGKEIIEIAKINNEFVVLNPDTKSCGLEDFGKMFPGREYQFGVAEQNLIGAAAGFASCGHKVIVDTYAVFISMRACEQVRTFVCYPKLNVTFIASHGGLQVGADGASHQALEDVGIMRSFPNMTVVQPADAVSARIAARAAVEFKGPLYVRVLRDPVPDVYEEKTCKFEIGKANLVRNYGNDVAIIATGVMVSKAVTAAERLTEMGIKAKVIDMHTLKPIDEEAIVEAAKATGAIVTVEDHNIFGGLGSAVAEVLSEQYPVRMKRIGVNDVFGESGDPESLFNAYGLTIDNIVATAKKLINGNINRASKS